MDIISVISVPWRMRGEDYWDTWLLIMFIFDLFMGAWGLDFPVSNVDLNQKIVTILLKYKVLQNHGILL